MIENRSIRISVIIPILFLVVFTGLCPVVNADPIPPEVADSAQDWPLPNKDYENSRSTFDSRINSGNVANLSVAWSFPIPGMSAFGAAASNPIIVGDKVYLQDLKCNVFCLDLQTGEVLWSKLYNVSNVVGPNGPAVGLGKVFVASDLYNITALDGETGEEIWRTKLSDIATTGIDIQPVVYDGLVYVSTVPGTGDIFYAPGGIGVIYALDAETGEVVWSFSTVDSDDLWGHPEVNSGGGAWYPPAVDTQTGLTFWGIGNPAPFPGTKEWPSGTSRPGPNLYTDSILALDHKTGELVWFRQVLAHDLFDLDFQISPILAEQNISGSAQSVVFGAGKMGKVYAFNRSTGEILWSTVVGRFDETSQLDVLPNETISIFPGTLGGVETPMAYSNGLLFVPVVNRFTNWTPSSRNSSPISDATGELVAIDASNGKIHWIRYFDSMALGGATVVNDLVFTAELNGTIHALKADSGEELFTYQAPAGINAWPAVAGDLIVWPAGDGADPSLIALKSGTTAEISNQSQNSTAELKIEAAAIDPANSTGAASLSSASNSTEISTEKGTAEWVPDGVISAGEYAENLNLSSGRYKVHWRNNADELLMGLEGRTEGFVAIGFEPVQAMMGADMIMGWVSGGKATVLDLNSTGTYGPHPPDEDLGGRDDILEFGGNESDGWTVIEFKRKMNTQDPFDKSFQPGQMVSIIWSMSSSDSLAPRHDVRGALAITLEQK